MLIENTVFGVIDKVDVAIKRLQTFEPEEGYYVAFSGGKDSVVLLDLVKKSGVKHDAHYNLTTVDPPELFYFIRDQHPEVHRHRPEMTIWKLIEKKMMPPTRLARYCCAYLKERGGENRLVVTGVRWAESIRRSKRRMTEACYKNERTTYLHPIIDWSDTDIWDYIKSYSVPYCHLYDEGFKRLGCVGCPMASRKKRLKEFARWPKYEKKYREAFQKVIDARKEKGKEWNDLHPSNEKWKDGASMFGWWMEDKHIKGDPDQTILFE